MRPIKFTLVVNDFGVKYCGKEHADYLLTVLNKHYKTAVDWEGSLYCRIKLEWNHEKRYVNLSMPGYIDKVRQRFQHDLPAKPQHTPFHPHPKKYGVAAQEPIDEDPTPRINDKQKTRIQKVVGMVLYYARSIDLTSLPGLSGIASEQADARESITKDRIQQLLDYLAMHPDAKVRYYASDMIINIHSDASYLSETRVQSIVAGYYFLGSTPTADKKWQ